MLTLAYADVHDVHADVDAEDDVQALMSTSGAQAQSPRRRWTITPTPTPTRELTPTLDDHVDAEAHGRRPCPAFNPVGPLDLVRWRRIWKIGRW